MNSDRLAVTVCATGKHQYAMRAQARAVHANLRGLGHPLAVILVGDDGLEAIGKYYRLLFGENLTLEVIRSHKAAAAAAPYKNAAQLLIAQMRTEAFTRARAFGATHCLSLDSDVIPKSSFCYRTLRWILDIPGHFYEVAVAPYPSQGGGDFLSGRGSPESPIFQDYGPGERKIGEELKKRMDANREALQKTPPGFPPAEEVQKEAQAIREEVEKSPPLGNVFEMNARFGWRRRGWLSAAYPAIGRGSIIPTDWCGFGCTLMSARALDECDFTGYEGAGTEDLFVCWHRWHQNGIRIAAAPHEPAFHISRRKDGKHFAAFVRFVTDGDDSKGECSGHLRILHKPWYSHDPGEAFDPQNDGFASTPAERKEAESAARAAQAEAAAAAVPAAAPIQPGPTPADASVQRKNHPEPKKQKKKAKP